MKKTQRLRNAGQSVWLDGISRDLLTCRTLRHYISELSVTGLTSNITMFDRAITHSSAYHAQLRELHDRNMSDEALFLELAVDDLVRAADLFGETYEQTSGVDGWVSLEVSPLLARNAQNAAAEAKALHAKAHRPNFFIKIPGTVEGLTAIEETIFAGVPVYVTLLFSCAQYRAAAEAMMRGVERRIAAGLSADVRSVASLFINRWDRAVSDKAQEPLCNRLGLAVAQQTYRAYRDLLDSDRWQRLANYGARPQRLLFADTSMRDPAVPDAFYANALVAPNTINTMPEGLLLTFAGHGRISGTLPRDGGDANQIIAAYSNSGIDTDLLAGRMRAAAARALADSWQDVLDAVALKRRVRSSEIIHA